MPHSKTGIFAISLMALALAGCQTDRFGGTSTPAPLTPAPSGTVTGTQLPPPSAFPEAPGQTVTDPQIAALDPNAAAAGGTIEVTKSALLGSWDVNSGGSICQMFLTLTKYGDSSRGGTRGCSNDLANMRAWDVVGNQVVLYDETGSSIARLYASAEERYSGQTVGGAPVSLSR